MQLQGLHIVRQLFILVFLCRITTASFAQYTGGNGNGWANPSSFLVTLGITDSLYNGGAGDGISSSSIGTHFLGISDSLYKGGSGDGFGFQMAAAATTGIADTVFSGGAGDGATGSIIVMQTLGFADGLYSGGSGRGDYLFYAVSANLAVCTSDTAVWNGKVSSIWAQAGNWDCGVVPGVNSHVIIPSGRPRYPVINVFREVRSIRLQPGSSLLINTGGYLKLNGQ